MASAVEALQRRWAAEDEAKARRRRAKARKAASKGGDGGILGSIKDFASDVVPDLGIGNTFEMLTSIPAGIGYIGSGLLPGGVPAGEMGANVGRGVLGSFENTASTIFKPIGVPFTDWSIADKVWEPAAGWFNREVVPGGEKMRKPQDLLERARDPEQGLLNAIIEDVGNVAIAGAAGARAAKLGELGTLAAPEALGDIAKVGGASGRLARQTAKWSERAAKVSPEAAAAYTPEQIAARARIVKGFEAAAHPYETAFRGTLGKSGAAAQAAQAIMGQRRGAREAIEAGDAEMLHALDFSGSGQKVPIGYDVDLAAQAYERAIRRGEHPGPPVRPVEAPEAPGVPGGAPEPSPGGLGRLERQLGEQPTEILDAEGNVIPPIAARVGPAEEAAIARKAVPPSAKLLARHLARLEGGGPGAKITNRLAWLQGKLDAKALRWVAREGERFVEAARRAERNEPWYQESINLASAHLVNQINPETGARISTAEADDMVGAEVMSRLWGGEMQGQALAEAMGEQWSPEAYAEFLKRIKAKKSAIPEALLTDDLHDQLDQIAAMYRERSRTRVGTLIGDRLGTTGLQSMNDDAPVMTKSQRKEYVRLKRQANHQATVMQRKIVRDRRAMHGQIGKIRKQIEDEGLDIERLNLEADGADQLAQDLLAYTAPLLKDGRRPDFWNAVVAQTLEDGTGATANPFTTMDKMFNTAGGYISAMLPGTVRRVRIDEFSPAVLEEVFQANRNFLTDQDARIGTWVHDLTEENITDVDRANGLAPGDRVVDIDFSQDTVNGQPMTRGQARILGMARDQEAVYGPDFADLYLPRDPYIRDLASVFRPLVRDDTSQFSKVLRSLYEVPYKLAAQKGIDPEDVNLILDDIDAMVDVGMAQAVHAAKNGNLASVDDFFKTWRAAVNYDPKRVIESKPDSLFQVVMNEPVARATFEKARKTFPQHEHLASWYHRSHDYIEREFRDMGDVTLLNGQTINMADLMYQLLAVTSIQSTPLTNFGNAMSAMRNLKVALSRTDDTMTRIVDAAKAWEKAGSGDPNELLAAMFPGRKIDPMDPEIQALGYRPAEVQAAADAGAATKKTAGYGTGIYPSGEQVKAVFMILSGYTMDRWGPETAGIVNKLFGGNETSMTAKNIPPETVALARRQLEALEDGPVTESEALERAKLLHYGSKAWAKLVSFHENLSNPARSGAVTLDEWMGRLFGISEWVSGGRYAEFTGKITRLADSLNMKPHEVQALLWAYAKHRVTRGEVGRLAAGAWDAIDQSETDQAFRYGTEADPLYRLIQEDLDLSVLDKDFRHQVQSAQKASRLATAQANDYWQTIGRKLGVRKPKGVDPWAEFDPDTVEAVGRWYEDAADATADPEMVASYDALVREVRAQYQYLTETLGVDVRFVTPDEEYGIGESVDGAMQQMAADLVNNKRLKVRGTTMAGDAPNEFMGLIDPETGVMFNDMFRAVHDAFGHAHANNFGRQGEQVAFRAHAQMFTPEALKALASETLGQNSALIRTGEFPEQKVVNIPDELLQRALTEIKPPRGKRPVVRKTRIAEPVYRPDGSVDYSGPTVSPTKIREENQLWMVGSDKDAMARSRQTYDTYRAVATRANQHLAANDPVAARAEILKWVRERTRSYRKEDASGFDEAANSRTSQGIADAADPTLDSEALVKRLAQQNLDGDTLFQAFGEEVRGALVREQNKAVDYTLRVFPNADFTTLMHEHAHLLRTMLPAEQVRRLEEWLGVSFDKADDAAWRLAEEKFADAFINYLYTGAAPRAGTEAAFNRIKEVIADSWEAWRDSPAANMELPDELYRFFDETLSPEVDYVPEQFNQFIPPEGPNKLRNIYEAPVHPGETPTGAKQRTYRAVRAAEDARLKRLQAAQKQKRVQRLQTRMNQVGQVLKDQQTPAEIEYARRQRAIQKAVHRLGRKLQNPATGQVPAKWQPLWDAFRRLAKEAEENPALELPEDFVGDFGRMLELAVSKGFDPQHIRSFTPKQVEGLMYGQMRLGADFKPVGTEYRAGTRAARTRPHAVAQSVSALAAAMVEVVHESQTNHLVDFIEGNLAQRVVGGFIPDGWVPWDPVRRFIVTGEKIIEQEGKVIETIGQQPTMMVPKAVADTIRNMGRDYTHWAFKALGKIQDPWRALILTMTPRWYVNNFLGNFMLATTQGVRLQDWLRAWHEYRQREFVGEDLTKIEPGELGRAAVRDVRQLRKGRRAQPFSDIPGVTGASIYSDLGDPRALMVPGGVREKLRYIAGTRDRSRVVTAYQTGIAKLSRANEVVDELARAATYFSATRRGLSPEAALMRAYTALIDYGDLSNFERQMVRAVIPFYAWQKGILKLVAKAGVEHPAGAAVVLQLDRLAQEWLEDKYGTELPQGYRGLIPFGAGAIQTRGMNPFADAGALVSAQGIARSMNPFAETLLRNELGAPEAGIVKEQRVNEYGRLVPEVNIPEAVSTDIVGGLPQVQLGQRITGTSPSPYEEPLTRSVGRYLGVSAMGEEELARLIERTSESRRTLSGRKKPRKRKKAKSPIDAFLSRLRSSSQSR